MASTRVACWLVVGALIAFDSRANATEHDPKLALAHDAYERGVVAFHRSDFRAAAREFAAADLLAPSAVAVTAGLDAALRADDAAIGMELSVRAKQYDEARLNALRSEAEKRFAERVGRVSFACAGAAVCAASLDGAAIDPSGPRFVTIGAHEAHLERDGASVTRALSVRAGELSVVAIPSTTVTGDALKPAEGPSRAWLVPLVGGGALSLGLLGVSLASAASASSRHEAFVAKGCASVALPGCLEEQASGRAAQTRANVLFGVTAGVAVASTIVTIALIPSRSRAPSVAIGPTSIALEAPF
jgi:hypothetical protein